MDAPTTPRAAGVRAALRGWGGPALVMAFLVAAAGVVTIRDRQPDEPAPDAPTAAAAPPAVPSAAPVPSGRLDLPAGFGTGVAYAQTATAVFRLDLVTGRFTRTPTPESSDFSSLVAGPGWVVSKAVDSTAGFVIRTGRAAEPLPGPFQAPGRLGPAPRGSLWFQPEDATDGTKTVRRYDISGRAVKGQTFRVADPDFILGNDGAGYLLWSNAHGAYQARPDGPRRLTRDSLLAVSRDHLLVWSCRSKADCVASVVDRSTQRPVRLPRATRTLREVFQTEVDPRCVCGDVSPDGSHVALWHQDLGDAYRLRVIDLRTGVADALPGAMTSTNGNTQMAWSRNGRWLLAVTDHRLRAYDTSTGRVEALTVTEEEVLHLTMRGAPGN